jgi:hypothetical protein
MRIFNSQLEGAKVSTSEFPEKLWKFSRHFKGLFSFGMREFESSKVSQAVTQLEIVGPIIR